jgi:hypothetical protein
LDRLVSLELEKVAMAEPLEEEVTAFTPEDDKVLEQTTSVFAKVIKASECRVYK